MGEWEVYVRFHVSLHGGYAVFDSWYRVYSIGFQGSPGLGIAVGLDKL